MANPNSNAEQTEIFTDIELPGCRVEDVRIRHSQLLVNDEELMESLDGYARYGDAVKDDVYLEGRFNKHELLALALMLWRDV